MLCTWFFLNNSLILRRRFVFLDLFVKKYKKILLTKSYFKIWIGNTSEMTLFINWWLLCPFILFFNFLYFFHFIIIIFCFDSNELSLPELSLVKLLISFLTDYFLIVFKFQLKGSFFFNSFFGNYNYYFVS